ncbi:MAG: efflux RND transporter periplasmic adaptor subunit [Bacillota bacterium]
MTKKKMFILAAVILIIAAGGYFKLFAGQDEGITHGPLEAMVVGKGNINKTITASGDLSPLHDRGHYFSRGGKVVEIFVENGDMVEAGADLVKLESNQEELTLIQARNAYQSALINGTETEIREREASLRIAEEDLADRTLKAEISGEVVDFDLAVGERVNASDQVLRLLDESIYLVKLNVDEGDSRQIEPGQSALIEISALPDETFPGVLTEVKKITRIINNVVVVPVEITMEGYHEAFRPGYTTDVEIIIASVEDEIVVPVTAIFTEAGRSYVVKVDTEGRPEEVEVEPGLTDGLRTEIVSGLSEGENILVNAYQYSERANMDDSLDIQFGPPDGDRRPGGS